MYVYIHRDSFEAWPPLWLLSEFIDCKKNVYKMELTRELQSGFANCCHFSDQNVQKDIHVKTTVVLIYFSSETQGTVPHQPLKNILTTPWPPTSKASPLMMKVIHKCDTRTDVIAITHEYSAFNMWLTKQRHTRIMSRSLLQQSRWWNQFCAVASCVDCRLHREPKRRETILLSISSTK